MNATSSSISCRDTFEAMPNAIGFFRDLGAAGFVMADIASVCGCTRGVINGFLKANPLVQTAYRDARRDYKGPGGKRAVLRLGLVEEDVDALIVAGVLYLDQHATEQSRESLADVARRLALTGAPDVESCLLALAGEIGDGLYD